MNGNVSPLAFRELPRWELSSPNQGDSLGEKSEYHQKLFELKSQENNIMGVGWKESIPLWEILYKEYEQLSQRGSSFAEKKLIQIRQKINVAEIHVSLKETITSNRSWKESEKIYTDLLRRVTRENVPVAYQADLRKKLEDALEITHKNLDAKEKKSLLLQKENKILKKDWNPSVSLWRQLETEYKMAANTTSIPKYKTLFLQKAREMHDNIAIASFHAEYNQLLDSQEKWVSVLEKYEALRGKILSSQVPGMEVLIGKIDTSIRVCCENKKSKDIVSDARQSIDYALREEGWKESLATHTDLFLEVSAVNLQLLTYKNRVKVQGIRSEVIKNISKCRKYILKDKQVYSSSDTLDTEDEERGEDSDELQEVATKKDQLLSLSERNNHFAYLYSLYLCCCKQIKEKAKIEKMEGTGEKVLSDRQISRLQETKFPENSDIFTVDLSEGAVEGEDLDRQREGLQEIVEGKGRVELYSSKENILYETHDAQKRKIVKRMERVLQNSGERFSQQTLSNLLKTQEQRDIKKVLSLL